MARDLAHEEMDEINARNDAVIEELENDLMEICCGLSDRIATANAEGDAGQRAMYELMRAVLDGAFQGTLCISRESIDGLRYVLHDNIICVNVIDDIIYERLDGVADKRWLGYSIRQYLKDYLYGACTILERDRLASETELLEDIRVMADSLRSMLLMRAGCTLEYFDGDRLCIRP